ncbi:MAG: hypothetical protein ACT4OK_19580 [Gemmobacter sp.]
MTMNPKRLAGAVALALSALPLTAAAQDREVLLTGYLFASAIDGRASVTSGLPPANIDLSFSDVLDDLDFGVMSAVEVRRGKWGFMGDLMYSKVSPSGTVPVVPALSAGLTQRTLTLQANALYRVHQDANVTVDLGAGLRYWNVDNAGSVAIGAASASFADSASWVDPVIIARMNARLGGAWSMTLAGDFGGFGVGSDETWQLLGTVNWHKSDRVAFRAGYRVLSVDYEDDGFVYDIRMSGPVVGVTFRF